MRKTKIICTIGPASENPEILSQIIEAGMNVSRHNFSHGDHEEHAARINLVKELAKKHNKEIAVMLDTKGPEIRTGKFDPKKVELQEGAKFTVHAGGDVVGNTEECSVTYAGLANDVKPGDTILIDDGLVGLTVESIEGNKIHCKVQNTGFVATHKGVNVPGVSIQLPALTEKDIADLKFGCEIGVNAVAASFIRKASDVEAIREILNANGGEHIQIISKIENQEGVDNIDSILAASDGLMVARGDLGVEIPFEKLPAVQKMMIEKCNAAGKPVVTATQMLDSMMISGESANGDWPVESVQTMARIAIETEKKLNYETAVSKAKSHTPAVSGVISRAACNAANELKAAAIVSSTKSGSTARRISQCRPDCAIVAVTPCEKVAKSLAFCFGVYPVVAEDQNSTDAMMANATKLAVENGFAKSGDTVIIAAGLDQVGSTNLLKVSVVE